MTTNVVPGEGSAAEAETPEVSRCDFSIAYEGAILAQGTHATAVRTLAPALLALGRLVREANTEFNGKKSPAKVLAVSDFEHKCFNINLEVIWSLYEWLKSLVGAETVKTAKEVLEWLGLLGASAADGTPSYLKYLKWKNGRKVVEAKTLTDWDRAGLVEVKVDGDSTAQVHDRVYHLSENPRALRATRDAFLPMGDGFGRVEVRQGDELVEEINWIEVEAIVASCNAGIEAAGGNPALPARPFHL